MYGFDLVLVDHRNTSTQMHTWHAFKGGTFGSLRAWFCVTCPELEQFGWIIETLAHKYTHNTHTKVEHPGSLGAGFCVISPGLERTSLVDYRNARTQILAQHTYKGGTSGSSGAQFCVTCPELEDFWWIMKIHAHRYKGGTFWLVGSLIPCNWPWVGTLVVDYRSTRTQHTSKCGTFDSLGAWFCVTCPELEHFWCIIETHTHHTYKGGTFGCWEPEPV